MYKVKIYMPAGRIQTSWHLKADRADQTIEEALEFFHFVFGNQPGSVFLASITKAGIETNRHIEIIDRGSFVNE